MQIAINLDTASFLDLRYVSRAMADVFNIQSFWKSRFRLDQDRGYLSYLTDDPQIRTAADWRLIFRSTADLNPFLRTTDKDPEIIEQSNNLDHLSTIKELWMQAKWLSERYKMRRASNSQISCYEHLATDPELYWKEFYAGVQCDGYPRQGQDKNACDICYATHILLTQAVPLQDLTIGIGVSVLQERMTTVITGFELLSSNGKQPNLIFGYCIPGRQVFIDLRGRTLTGFTIFSSQGRVHALRPIFYEKEHVDCKWIGQPTICKGLPDTPFEPCTWAHQPKICRGSLDPFRLCNSHDGNVDNAKTKVTRMVLDQGIRAFCGKFDVSRSYLNIGSREVAKLMTRTSIVK